MNKFVPPVLALALLTVATSSQACHAYLGPKERLAFGYRSGAISSVALVRIKSASYTAERVSDEHPWQAEAIVENVLRGSYRRKSVIFRRGLGSSMCDDGHPVAKVGERWIVYLWKSAPGAQVVWQAYPAAVAYAADPLLARKVH